jgi:hypothetical protein
MVRESERGTRSSVEAALDASQIGGRMLGEVGASGHVLAQESIGVLLDPRCQG